MFASGPCSSSSSSSSATSRPNGCSGSGSCSSSSPTRRRGWRGWPTWVGSPSAPWSPSSSGVACGRSSPTRLRCIDMARFEPFRGFRYDTDRVELADVVAPPYDVVDDEARARLEARSPYNGVLVELGRVGADDDRYQRATRHFDDWLAEGILRVNEEPSFYVYRMGWHDEAGTAHQTTGILGALELSPPEDGR